MDSFSTFSSSWFPSSYVQEFYAYAPFAVQAYRVVEKSFQAPFTQFQLLSLNVFQIFFLCVSKGLAASEAQKKKLFLLNKAK